MGRFWALYSAQAVSLTGSVLNSVISMFWIYGITGSITKSVWGFVALSVVYTVVSTLAAAVIDRDSKKKYVLTGEIAQFFVFLVFYFMAKTGSKNVWAIYGLQAVMGAANAFFSPAISAWQLACLKGAYKKVLPLTRSLNTAINISGITAAGVLAHYVQFQTIFLFNAVTFLVAFLIEACVPEEPVPARPAAVPGAVGYFREMLNDIKSSAAHMTMDGGGFLKITLLFMVVNAVFAPLAELLPMVVKIGFSGTPAMYSMILLANSFGVLLAGLLLSWRPVKNIYRYVGLVVLFNGAVSCATFFINDFKLFVLMVFLVGLGLGSVNIGINLLVSGVRADYYCRVRTHSENISGFFIPFGLLLISMLAEKRSVMSPFLLSGVVVLLAGAVYLADLGKGAARKTAAEVGAV